jgi:preprotein translocase subunit SecB
MKTSPLQLEGHFATSVRLDATESTSVGTNFRVNASPNVGQESDDSLVWVILLDVSIKHPESGPQSPYTGHIKFYGRFRLSPTVPADRRLQVVIANGSSILYGAVRELVANLSARGPHPMITLPSLSFVPKRDDTELIEASPRVPEKATRK